MLPHPTSAGATGAVRDRMTLFKTKRLTDYADCAG